MPIILIRRVLELPTLVCDHKKKHYWENGRRRMGCVDEQGDFIVDANGVKIWARDCNERETFGRRYTRVMACERCFLRNENHLVERDSDASRCIAMVVLHYAFHGVRPNWNVRGYNWN